VARGSNSSFVRGLLEELDREDRRIGENIFKSLKNVKTEFFL